MKTQKIHKIALKIAQETHDAGLEHGDAKVAMFQAGIEFSRLNSAYKAAAIELDIVVDPTLVTEELNDKIAEVEWDSLETWGEVQEVIDALESSTRGATARRVLTLIRVYCREEEISLPKRSVARKPRGGRAQTIVVDMVNADSDTTRQDCYDALMEVVAGDNPSATATSYVNKLLPSALAVANGITLSEAMEKVAGQLIVEDGESEGEEE